MITKKKFVIKKYSINETVVEYEFIDFTNESFRGKYTNGVNLTWENKFAPVHSLKTLVEYFKDHNMI